MKTCVTLALVALTLQSAVAQSNTCKVGSTGINSPWLFSETETCPDLVASVPDFYNDVYLSECERQLGTGKPHNIDQAEISECHDMKNGTVKYKATICCPGELQAVRCFTCSNVSIEFDNQKSAYSTYRCNHLESVSTCPSGQVCATVHTYVAGKRVDKMCMDKTKCLSAVSANTATCKSGIAEPTCTYCCDTPLCNYYNRVESLTPGNACYPNPCYNGQPCILDSSVTAGYRCNCTAGTSGNLCQNTMCSSRPCQNNGWCEIQTTAPYYLCSCQTGWHGINCTDAYDLCDSTTNAGFCENGGVCFDHGQYGVRCKCPEGYHGTKCELQVVGEERCSDPNLYYSMSGYYLSSIGSTPSTRCTERSEYYSDVASKMEVYGKICAAYMQQGYTPGVDGELTAPENMNLYRCSSGDLRSWYSFDVCCPSCTRKPCQNGGWCIQTGDDYACRCRLGYGGDRCQFKEALCFVSGDPHILTFDNANLHPQGICKYNIATSTEAANIQNPFDVSAKFERRGSNSLVSYVKYVDITVFDHEIRLGRNNIVSVDGVTVDPTTNLEYAGGKLKIFMNGNFVRVETDFGLVVENDGYWTALIKMPTDFVNITDGLCGDNDGDSGNDVFTKEGVDVTGMFGSQSVLANSWQVDDPEDPTCKKEVVEDLKDCDATLKDEVSNDFNFCGLLANPTDASNPFRSCLSNPELNAEAFADNCIFDVCAMQGDVDGMKEAACGTLAALAMQCKNLGIIVDWRDISECPFNCTGGRTYTKSGSACTLTCANPKAVSQCTLPSAETCECLDGLVFHEGRCQERSVCGCVDGNGTHYETGQTWLSDDCCEIFTCTECTDCEDSFGKIEVEAYECPSSETCSSGVCKNNDPCLSNPCQNNGTCVSINDESYGCECSGGFNGTNCEIEDPCYNVLCKNGGSCSASPNGFVECICTGVFSGDQCEDEPCDSNPCQNNGTCTALTADTYSCACSGIFSGDQCEDEPCDSNPCQNNGICTALTADTYSCACSGIFSGDQCEDEPCDSNPCQNNGICTALTADTYSCSCQEGFQGMNCEVKIYYIYGPWSEWTCASVSGQVRERDCIKMPDNVVVSDRFCTGSGQDSRDVEADCTKCEGIENGRGYLAHECDETAFWVCQWIAQKWISTRRVCGPCTKWDQTQLTCIHAEGPCDNPTTPTTPKQHDSTPQVNSDSCVAAGGNVYQIIPNNLNSYQWVIADGRSFVMPCAPGTTFELASCGCVLNNVAPVAPADSDEITCLDFTNVGRWGFSGSKWKWISNVGPVTKQENCGVDGSCAYFDGTSHLEIGFFKQSSTWNQLNQFSVSLWFKKEGSITDTEYLVQYGYCDEADSIVMRVESDTSVGGGIVTPSGNYMNAFSGNQVSPNKWHHLVMVFDSTSGKLHLYVDGVLSSTEVVNGVLQYRYCPMVIGRTFKGSMDQVCFYNAALTQAEVLSLFQA